MEMNERSTLSPEEKRELRRQRRIRNLIWAYAGLALILLAVAAGGFFGFRALRTALTIQEQEKQIEEQLLQAAMEEESLAAEEETTGQDMEEESTEESEEAKLLDEIIAARIGEMTLEEKVAGLFLVTPEALTGVNTAIQAGDATKTALEEYPVGGLIYFKKNITSEEQIRQMLANTVSYSAYPLFLAVDEEGGEVARVADALGLENIGDMAGFGEAGDTESVYAAMQTVGNYLTGYGFNLNFAPVADILTNPDNTSIGARSFGSDAATVSSLAVAAASGLGDAGVVSCMKHFPGIGSAGEDTHNGLVVVDRSLEELTQEEFLPFEAGIEAGIPMIMVGHVSLPQVVGDNTPASMSSAVISDILRAQLGFNGVVITDAMNMGAITEYYGADEAAIMALRAGADMVLMPEDFELAYEGVITAVHDGSISEERIDDSLTRIYRIKMADSVGGD